MKRRNALIVISPLMSHALPSMYIADILRQDGYDVHYLTHLRKNIKELVEAWGFTFIQSHTSNIGYLAEAGHVVNTYRKKSWFYQAFKFVQLGLSNQLYKERKKEIDEIMQSLDPEIVLVDVFSITNFVFFYQYKDKLKHFYFLSPMLSTHTKQGFPILSDREWIKDIAYERQREKTHPLKNNYSWLNRVFDYLIIKRICRQIGLQPENAMEYNRNYFTFYSFKNIPELILAPLELEISPAVKDSNQHYMGLCVQPDKGIVNVDPKFDLEQITAEKRSGKKILFCSFGTYFTSYEQHKAICTFITTVIASVIEEDNWLLIVASSDKVLDVIGKTLPEFPNVWLYSKVPQLKMLRHSDVFITHGGLGSMKEAIHFEVPMLVYPLDEKWDNNGNAFKVTYHGIGLAGDMRQESQDDLHQKVSALLTNKEYKYNISRLSESLRQKYTPEYARETFYSIRNAAC